MCHVSRLNEEELGRLLRMDADYQAKLEAALEDGRVKSTRTAVKPVFEAIYAKWCDRYGIVTAPRKPEKVVYERPRPGMFNDTMPTAVSAFR